jgi:hypothetical protein
MKEQDWKKLQTSTHIRNVMKYYSKIKNGFANETKIKTIQDDLITIYGIEKIKEELLVLKTKLEKYRTLTGI